MGLPLGGPADAGTGGSLTGGGVMLETYTYVNIFETKGLEYLLLISFLVLFIIFVRYFFSSARS